MARVAALRSQLEPSATTIVGRRSDHPPLQGRYRVLTGADADGLLMHFESLSMRERIVRFHGAMSDVALAAYVGAIDWSRHWIVAECAAGRILSVAELVAHPREGWRDCELALTLTSQPGSHQVPAELIQLAVLTARQRGSSSVRMWWHAMEPLMRLLRLFPDLACGIRVGEDDVVVDFSAWLHE